MKLSHLQPRGRGVTPGSEPNRPTPETGLLSQQAARQPVRSGRNRRHFHVFTVDSLVQLGSVLSRLERTWSVVTHRSRVCSRCCVRMSTCCGRLVTKPCSLTDSGVTEQPAVRGPHPVTRFLAGRQRLSTAPFELVRDVRDPDENKSNPRAVAFGLKAEQNEKELTPCFGK